MHLPFPFTLFCHPVIPFIVVTKQYEGNNRAIFKTSNGERGTGNGERGTGNGERGIFKTGNL